MKKSFNFLNWFYGVFILCVGVITAVLSWAIPETVGIGSRTYAYQSAPDTVNASATLVATDLTTTIAANQKVHIRYYVPIDLGGTAGGIKFQVNAPAAPNSYVVSCALFTDSDTLGLSTTIVSETAFGVTLANAGLHFAIIDATIHNGTSAGNITLEFAQNSAQSENCIVLTGGYAEITKL